MDGLLLRTCNSTVLVPLEGLIDGLWLVIIDVCVLVEGVYTYKTGHFGNKILCLCLCCFRGYVNIKYWTYWKKAFVFMFVFL